MPSSGDRGDAVDRALTRAARWVCAAVADSGTPAPVVLIDGRSGSGKSTVAAVVARTWPGPVDAQVLALDSLYPGWDGLAAATEMLRADILQPRAAGRAGVWHRWDWARDRAAEAHRIDPAMPLIVEGAGAISPGTAPYAPIRVWLESPPLSRRTRALARDGDAYRPYWERWAAQEGRHLALNSPSMWATHVFSVP